MVGSEIDQAASDPRIIVVACAIARDRQRHVERAPQRFMRCLYVTQQMKSHTLSVEEPKL
jgi:hypothetical protein